MKYLRSRLRTLLSCMIPLAASFLLAALFSLWDLSISQTVADPHHPLGRALELPGQLIAPLFIVLSGITILVLPGSRPRPASAAPRIITGILTALGGLIYSCFIFSSFPAKAAIACALLLAVGCMLWTSFLLYGTHFHPENLYRIALTVVVHVLLLLVVVSAIKLFWGRLRYRDMLNAAGFSHWFIPQGITGNYSFPSGHTAYCACAWAVTLFAPLTGARWKKVLCYLLPALAILVMAVSRVLAGAHYTSDVMIGAGLSIALFYLAAAIVQRVLRTGSRR